MFFRREKKDNLFYIGIAIFVVILILLTVLFSTNSLTKAYIDDHFLTNGWLESGDRSYNEQLFGLEKQSSFRYIYINSSYENFTTFLTITTIKTIFMINEQELLDKTIETIYNAARARNISINNFSKFSSSRFLKNGHNTFFIVLNGTQKIDGLIEKIKIIGETWNCAYSGTSIICIGVAQTTNAKNGNYSENIIQWAKIICDEKGTFNEIYNNNYYNDINGLIFNVKCH